jgi:hypothetical protein
MNFTIYFLQENGQDESTNKVEAQQKAMEMEQREIEAITNRKCIILDRGTFLEKGTKIPDPKQFMWTETKQNNDKHVQRMEN